MAKRNSTLNNKPVDEKTSEKEDIKKNDPKNEGAKKEDKKEDLPDTKSETGIGDNAKEGASEIEVKKEVEKPILHGPEPGEDNLELKKEGVPSNENPAETTESKSNPEEEKETSNNSDAAVEEKTESTPQQENADSQPAMLINPVHIFNMAVTIKEEIMKADVDPATLWRQTLGKGGVMANLAQQKQAIPDTDHKNYDELLTVIRGEIEKKLKGYWPVNEEEEYLAAAQTNDPNAATASLPLSENKEVTQVQPTTSEQTVEVAPPAPALTPQEKLDERFGLLLKKITEHRDTRICHASHVHDFCKNNSIDGFVFTFEGDNKLVGKYYSGKYTTEAEFKLK